MYKGLEEYNLSGVSCVCLTYGRPRLLEEAVYSFLMQTWEGPKELIIVNDHQEQTILLDKDYSDIFVVNLKRRLRTLGEKRNFSVSLCSYDNILIWDDDDIYLPWRIEETMKTLETDQFYKCPNAWVMNDDIIDKELGYNLYHSGSGYTRWLYEKAKGYSPLTKGDDSDIEWRFQTVTDKKGEYWKHTNLSRDRIYYIYRWNHGSFHVTGVEDLKHINPIIEKGEKIIVPQWKQDYVDVTRKLV